MARVYAGEALELMCEAAVLIASLHELAPDFVEALMVALQQMTVRLPHLIPLALQILQHLHHMLAANKVLDEFIAVFSN